MFDGQDCRVGLFSGEGPEDLEAEDMQAFEVTCRVLADGPVPSTANGGPKCRHDHVLKDHGWKHQRIRRHDIWTSPLGHTYTTQKPP